MPCFEPTLDQSLKAFPRVLIEIALGVRQVEEFKLSLRSRFLLNIMRTLLDSGIDSDELIRRYEQEPMSADQLFDSEIRATFESLGLINTARVFCLTTEFDNDVMWAHYAENHKGIVLGFRHLLDRDTPFIAAKAVTYSDQVPVIGSGLDFLLYGATPELLQRTINAVCFTKSSRWQYESEWRAVTWRPEEVGNDFGDYKFYPEELESICFGAHFDNQCEEEIRALVLSKYPKTSLYRMVVKLGKMHRILT